MAASKKPWKQKKQKGQGGSRWSVIEDIAKWYGFSYEYRWEHRALATGAGYRC